MSTRPPDGGELQVPRDSISRRRLLAVGGVLAVGGLSGCLDRVASAATNTGAAPAAVFTGVDSECCFDYNADRELSSGTMSLGEPRVFRLTPTLSAGSGSLSGEVELEGWVTSSAVVAANYNNTRSNKSTIASPVDFFGDDLDETDETFRAVSELDGELQDATEAAVASISKRSARTGRDPETEKEIQVAFDDIDGTLSELRAVLERCSDESCVAALENVERREAGLQRARELVENSEWEAALEALASPIHEGDSVGGESALYRGAVAPPDGPLSEAQRAELVEYLGGEPIVSERFTVCLPDAEVPGGNGSIRDAVTPKRLIDYMTGQSDASSRVYSWGDLDSDDDGIIDCDETERGSDPPGLERVCGEVGSLTSTITAPTATGGSLEATRASDGTLAVVNTPPAADGGASVLVCPVDAEVYEPDDLSQWGRASKGVPVQITQQGRIISQAMVQPPGCPHPFPALLYVGRGVSDGQLVYLGGWVIDDAALYADSLTVLTMAGETRVVPVDIYDFDSDGDGFSDGVSRSLSSERARRGARIDSGTVGELVEAGVLSDSLDLLVLVPGRGYVESRLVVTGDEYGFVTHVPVDAPVLHMVNAEKASNKVKFKSGAALSGQVN